MKILITFLVLVSIISCSSHPRTGDGYAQGTPTRYLAWLEGDLQNNYEPDRKIAEEKLKTLEAKVGETADTTAQIEYLSVLDASGKSAETGKKIKAFLTTNPDDKRGVFLLGVHYLRNRKKELAKHLFTQLENDSSFPWKSLLYNNLGMLALQEKNRRAAMDYFEKATKTSPPLAAPLVNLGSLYLQSRSYDQAYPLFERAVAIDDQMEDAYLGLGASLEGVGKFEEAHQTYASGLSKNPNALSMVYNDSVILGNRLKRRAEAAEQMLRYIQRGGKETAKAHEIIQGWR